MGYSQKKITRIVFALISLSLLIIMLNKPSNLYGDGAEYYLMIGSFSNHMSPDLRIEDTKSFGKITTRQVDELGNVVGETKKFLDPNVVQGYFRDKDGALYSYHFWAYSLLCAPMRILLGFLHMNWTASMQFTNTLLFIVALAAVTFVAKLSEQQKTLLLALMTLSPALWFIHWTHPEIYSFAFVTLALVFLSVERYPLSVLFAAVASLQNQPLIIFVLYLTAKALTKPKMKATERLQVMLMASVALIPNIFYWVHYSRLSLLENSLALGNLSIYRILGEFTDLNIGLLPYIPIPLILYIWAVAADIQKKGISGFSSQAFIVVLLMVSVTSMASNLNSGTSGPTRYNIWLLPIIFWVIAADLKAMLKDKYLKGALAAAIVTQLLIMGYFGLFPGDNSVDLSYAAKLALDNVPWLYNPPPEIFCERVLQKEVACPDPLVYGPNKRCVKAILTCGGLEKLRRICGAVPDDVVHRCDLTNSSDWFYVNY